VTAYEALEAQQEAIAGDIAAWLQCALDPNHPGAPAADRIVGIYMLADIANAITRIADHLTRAAQADAPDMSAAVGTATRSPRQPTDAKNTGDGAR
jgi:hypothetical protein